MAGKQQTENLSQLEDLVLGKIMDTIEQKLDSQFKRIREETKEQMTEMFSKMINSLTALERKVNSQARNRPVLGVGRPNFDPGVHIILRKARFCWGPS